MTASRRARHLVAEAIREIAVLGTVFVPVDAANDGRLTLNLFFTTVVVGSIVFSLGIWLEVRR
jgi:hypothetical protein